MFLRAVTSSILVLGLCLPHVTAAHCKMKGVVQHGDVTYYYSANGRVFAKEIDDRMYYRSSPEYLIPGYSDGDIHTHQNAPYYTHYVYEKYSYEDNRLIPPPYHWTYIYKVC